MFSKDKIKQIADKSIANIVPSDQEFVSKEQLSNILAETIYATITSSDFVRKLSKELTWTK